MPKKYQQKSLQIKPPSSSPHTLSLSKASSSAAQQDLPQRSVNDLIRNSRRQQLRNEQLRSPPVVATTAGSVPPSVRAVLDLPPPPPPEPRRGRGAVASGLIPGAGYPSPARLRRIPGPPPPRSWLTDSIHAPAKYRQGRSGDSENDGRRLQVRSSTLPAGSFPPPDSLQHLVLKRIACHWSWHAEYDRDYLSDLPSGLKETLLSYLAVYNEVGSAAFNPLRILFLDGEQNAQEARDEVQRLDLGNGIGLWTALKGLEKDLFTKTIVGKSPELTVSITASETPESWDVDDDDEDISEFGPSLVPRVMHNFGNLRHLSLSISPGNTRAASWSSLISIATELGTLSSLSLAYWPQPTFTPNAASTRVVLNVPGARPVVYGGTDVYNSLDNDWREAAGILRTLSRALYCLTWLDLTGCGDWWDALLWTAPSTGDKSENVGPEWNGGWRGLEKLVLHPGWKSIAPPPESHTLKMNAGWEEPSWNIEHERLVYRFKKDEQRLLELENKAKSVASHLRAARKSSAGKWIDVDLGRKEALAWA